MLCAGGPVCPVGRPAETNQDVGIRELDVDATFELERRYGLVLFFGILYHLRNPFLALDKFSTCAEYMLLSTRVARRSADGRTKLDDVSVGYLLDPDESNNDATNWWIFSRPGLRKLVRRAEERVLVDRVMWLASGSPNAQVRAVASYKLQGLMAARH